MSIHDEPQVLDSRALEYASVHHLHELVDALISEVAEKQPADPIACMIDFVQARIERKMHASPSSLQSSPARSPVAAATRTLASARARADDRGGATSTGLTTAAAAAAAATPASMHARIGRVGVWYHIRYGDLAAIARECKDALRAQWPSSSSTSTANAVTPAGDDTDDVPLDLLDGDMATLLPRLAAAAEAEHVSGLAQALRLVPLSPHRHMAAALHVLAQVVLAHAPLATPSQVTAFVQFMQHVGRHLQDRLLSRKEVLMREAWGALRRNAAAWRACEAHARAALCYLDPLLLHSMPSPPAATTAATAAPPSQQPPSSSSPPHTDCVATTTTMAVDLVAGTPLAYEAFVLLLDRVAATLPSWSHVESVVASPDVAATLLPPDLLALYSAALLYSIERVEGGVWCTSASVHACQLVCEQLLHMANAHVQQQQQQQQQARHAYMRRTDERVLRTLLHFFRQGSADIVLYVGNSSSDSNNGADKSDSRQATTTTTTTTTLARALCAHAAYSEAACDAFCRVAAATLRQGDASASYLPAGVTAATTATPVEAHATSQERLLMRCKTIAFRHLLGVLLVLVRLRHRISLAHAQRCVVRCLMYGVPFADLYVRFQDAFDNASSSSSDRNANDRATTTPARPSTREGALQTLALLQHVCQSMVTYSSFASLTQSLRLLVSSVALPQAMSPPLCTIAPQATALPPALLARCVDMHGYVRELLDCVLSSERASEGGGDGGSDGGDRSCRRLGSVDALLSLHVRMALRLRLCDVAALPHANALSMSLIAATAAVVSRAAPSLLLPAVQLAMTLDTATQLHTRDTQRTTHADRAVLLSYFTQHTPSRLLMRALDALTRQSSNSSRGGGDKDKSGGDKDKGGGDDDDDDDVVVLGATRRRRFLRATVPYEALERAFVCVLVDLLRCRDDDDDNDATSDADAVLRRPVAMLAAYGVTRHDCVLVCLALTQQLRTSRALPEAEWLLFCSEVLARVTRLLPCLPPLQPYTGAAQRHAVVRAQACVRRWLARRRVTALRRRGYYALARDVERVIAAGQRDEQAQEQVQQQQQEQEQEQVGDSDASSGDGSRGDANSGAVRHHGDASAALFGDVDRRLVQLTWHALGVDAQTRVVYGAVTHARELATCDARFLRPSFDALYAALGTSAYPLLYTSPPQLPDDRAHDDDYDATTTTTTSSRAARATTTITASTRATRDAQYALWSTCQTITAHVTSLIRALHTDKDSNSNDNNNRRRTNDDACGEHDGWQMVWRVVYDGSVDVFFQHAVRAEHVGAFCVLLAESVCRTLALEQPRVRVAWMTFLGIFCSVARSPPH